jgi:hypothetical protein
MGFSFCSHSHLHYNPNFGRFSVYPEEPEYVQRLRAPRQGFYGWQGFGGAVMQWHPKMGIGFAYTPTLLTWYANYRPQ